MTQPTLNQDDQNFAELLRQILNHVQGAFWARSSSAPPPSTLRPNTR
ncbi:MAG: hypothetical protein R2865_14355 [Deinococcales bacterium]